MRGSATPQATQGVAGRGPANGCERSQDRMAWQRHVHAKEVPAEGGEALQPSSGPGSRPTVALPRQLTIFARSLLRPR